MTKELGFQELKICNPHGIKEAIVVKIDNDCLVAFGPDFGLMPGTAGWVHLAGSKDGTEYIFRSQNELKKYNVIYNILEPKNIDENCINKLTLYAFEKNMTPMIIEVLSVEKMLQGKKVKMIFPEQTVWDMENETVFKFGPKTTFAYVLKSNVNDYVVEFEDI